jgi:zinc protease
VTLREAEQGIDAVINDIVAHGVTADELDRAKTRLIADAVYAQDNQATLARWYGAGLATGQTVDQVRGWPDRIRAVTADAVQQAARTWLDRRQSVTGYLVKNLQSEESHS